MIQRLKAVFRDGAFVPEEPCDIAEETHVDLVISPHAISESVRASELKTVIERMQRNPIPPGSPKFTRDELHERG